MARLESNMSKIGMMFSLPNLDNQLAEHFGTAKWLALVSSPSECEVVRNEALNGHGVALELSRRGCTDVIASHIGPGAFAHLSAAGIRVWRAAPEATGRAQIRLLEAGALTRFEPEPESGHEPRRHGGGRGRGPMVH